MERLEAIVHGRVQGVGFRFFVETEAVLLGLNGFVRNMPDGTVEVVVEGERGKLTKFSEALANGPPLSKVESVKKSWVRPTGEFSGFSVEN